MSEEKQERYRAIRDIMEDMGWEYGSEEFYRNLIKAGDTHSMKNHDYTKSHAFENFFLVALMYDLRVEDVVNVFIGTKAVRIGSLLSRGEESLNEPIADSYLDSGVYSLIAKTISEMDYLEKRRVFTEIILAYMFKHYSPRGKESNE